MAKQQVVEMTPEKMAASLLDKTEEEIIQPAKKEEDFLEEEIEEDIKGKKKPVTQVEEEEEEELEIPIPDTFAYKPLWEQAAKDGLKIPKEYLKGEFGDLSEMEALQQVLLGAGEEEEDEETDPFIRAYMSVDPDKRPGFLRSFMNQMEFLNMDSKNGVRVYLLAQKGADNKAKYTEEEADAYIGKKDKIELDELWDRIRDKAQAQQDEFFKSFTPSPENEEKKRVKTNQFISQRVDAVLKDFDTLDTFGEVTLTKEMKDEFKNLFRAITQINPRTGQPYLIGMISDDNVLRDVLLSSFLLDGGHIKKHISTFKEDFKGEFFSKLRKQPRKKPAQSASFRSATKGPGSLNE